MFACIWTAVVLGAVPPTGVYLGEFDDAPASARVALVAGDAEIVAYVCSDDDEFNDAYGRWFRGPIQADGGFELTSDGLSLSGVLAFSGASGTIESTFVSARKFRAKPIDPDDRAGLFRFQELEGRVKCTTGWIVDLDGVAVGSTQRQREADAERSLASPADRVLANRLAVRGERILPDNLSPKSAEAAPARPLLAPLPGDRLRVRLVGMNADARKLVVEMRGQAYDLELLSKQLVLVEDDETRLEEVATVARTRQSLARLPAAFRERLANLLDAKIQAVVRIGGGRIEIRRARAASRRAADANAEPPTP